MTQPKVNNLTLEQKSLIPIYRDKWKQIARSTKRIDRQKASERLREAYVVVGAEDPEVFFFHSPYAALNAVECFLWERLKNQLITRQWKTILENLPSLIEDDLFLSLPDSFQWDMLWNELWDYLFDHLVESVGLIQGACHTEKYLYGEQIDIEMWACYGSFFDFCISALNCNSNSRTWELFQSLSSEFYWIYPYRGICLVCDRPTKLSFDDQDRIHAEGEPAIQFADGFSIYAHHGEYINHEVIEPG